MSEAIWDDLADADLEWFRPHPAVRECVRPVTVEEQVWMLDVTDGEIHDDILIAFHLDFSRKGEINASNDQNLWMALGGVVWRRAHLPEDDREVFKVLIRTGVGALVREGTPLLKVVEEVLQANVAGVADGSSSVLDELVRDAARQMLAVALQAEVDAYIDAHAHEVDQDGRRLVVRTGHYEPREVLTAAGPVPVRAPRVNDKRVDAATGQRAPLVA